MKTDGVYVPNFSKFYSSKKACSSINFTAEKRMITGLLGPNGAGKSTLLKAVCAVHYPDEGNIEVYEKHAPEEIKQITGFSEEEPELEKTFSVKETLMLNCLLHGIKKRDAEHFVKEALCFTDIADISEKKVSSLSKGYLKRLSISKAVCFNPEVLVLDEFSSGLDPVQTNHVKKSILSFAENKTVILSTHRIEEAEELCSRIYIMNHGSVAAYGTIDEILKQTGTSSLKDAFMRLTSE